MKSMKGQTEIIIVLGVVIVGVVAVLFATKTINLLPPEPESVSILKVSLKADIERAVSADIAETIKQVAENGGWLRFSSDAKALPPTIDYLGKKIAYWQYAGSPLARTKSDFEKAIKKGLEESIKIDPQSFASVKGKNVKIEKLKSVDVKIGPDSVVVKVDLPVSVEGYGFEGPIEIKSASSLGKAIDFGVQLMGLSEKKELAYRENNDEGKATDNVLGVLENRYFERFTIDAIRKYTARDELGNPVIPSEGFLNGCGMSINKGAKDIKPEMEDLIVNILENTYTAGKVPANVDSTKKYPSYALPIFTDLNVKFALAKPLDNTNFQLFQNNNQNSGRVIVSTNNVGFTSFCFSPPYRVFYNLFYPVVAEVGDQNLKLRFAFHTYVDGYQPGDYKNTEKINQYIDLLENEQDRCVKSALCPVKLTVLDGISPVKSAEVSFAYCDVGKTDKYGVVEGNAPCGVSTLEIRDRDHLPFSSFESSDSLKEGIVFLSRLSPIKLHIADLEVSKLGDVYSIDDVKPNTRNFSLVVSVEKEGKPLQFAVKTGEDSAVTDVIPTGEQINISTVVFTGAQKFGGFDTLVTGLPEGIQELWLYNPVFKEPYPEKPLPNPPAIGDDEDTILQKESDPQNSATITENLGGIGAIRLKTNTLTAKCANKLKTFLPVSLAELNTSELKTCSFSIV